MASGRVKWWNDEKGFGFITDSAGQDVFVHCSAIETSGFQKLNEGAVVEYEIVAGQNGPMAQNVRPEGTQHISGLSSRNLPSTMSPPFLQQPHGKLSMKPMSFHHL